MILKDEHDVPSSNMGGAGLRPVYVSLLLCFILVSVIVPGCLAFEFSGYVETEITWFPAAPLYDEQERNSVSLSLEPEIYHEYQDGSSFVFVPFVRIDSADNERSHADIRELNYLWLADAWELRIGMGKVFWGVTEFIHLIDIINQTDLVEDIDMEEKLGQPMVQLSIPRDWGVLDLFVLPWFRERTFPGEDGRFRSQPTVDTELAEYEDSAKERHIDIAARYSHSLGDWDFGIYHFKGTGREPTLELRFVSGAPVLVPLYEIIDQTGIDVQAVKGEWLLKLEYLHRSGQGEPFHAVAGGLEYSFVNVKGSGMDLGLIAEWAYDDRREGATTIFDNDLMLGARLAINDAASSEALIGIIEDLDNDGRILSLESSRRFGDRWKLQLNAFLVADAAEDDALHGLRDDDYIRLDLAYFF